MKSKPYNVSALLLTLGAGAAGPICGSATAQPSITAYPVGGSGGTVATAAAALAGVSATANSVEDLTEIRDVDLALIRAITRQEISALLPWMSLGPGPDGPSGLAFSDSGRLLFILIHDANPAPGGPSDAVLRYDTGTDTLSVFARLELFDRDDASPHLAVAHSKGRLYVGSDGLGGPGTVHVYAAGAGAVTGVELSVAVLPAGSAVHGLAVDRGNGFLYAASGSAIYRANLATTPLSFALVGELPDLRGLAYSDHFGGPGNDGLFALRAAETGPSVVLAIPPLQALGVQPFAPISYFTTGQEWHSIVATADGALLVGVADGAALVSDLSDTRLSYHDWLMDEFGQVVTFAKGLISPDGEPPGWVIDADVDAGLTRFHPATADGAAWAVLVLLMGDRLLGDPAAQGLVRTILTRYAGLAPDGIRPSITADGVMRHWIDPLTGQTKPGWSPEFATLSTMHIVLAASRAREYYPGDAAIQQATGAIICQVRNQGAYVQAGSDRIYLKGLVGGGPDPTSVTSPFNEAILLAEQLAFYGGAAPAATFAHWLDRPRWPIATYLAGRPITGDVPGQFQAAFTSLYPYLLQAAFRTSPEWQQQIASIRDSNGAWTDDHAPRFNTLFSAGTTRSDWGGYHADSLGNHPGDLTTLPSLMAFSASGHGAPAVGAYNAYRRGARQTFATGASLLYRRSDIDRAYRPNSAGLPDVALGALGLAELIQPGSVAAVLAIPYRACCYANCDGSTTAPILNVNDFVCFQGRFAAAEASANCDGSTAAPVLNVNDFLCFLSRFAAGCP